MENIIAVIGGGAAGLMASYHAAANGSRVFLFERNNNLGRKVLISGKGRCNLTNAKNISEFIENIPGNGKFLYSAFNNFSNTDLITFFGKLGVKTKVERGGRVFPVSDRSLDVVMALHKALRKLGVQIMFNHRVKDILVSEGRVKGIQFYDVEKVFTCDKAILATGGLSYPATGSTGDGYEIARRLGHTVTDLMPSLVPLITKEKWVKELQGLTLKNVEVTLISNGKKIAKEFGEMLFTHFGVSGPIILTISRKAVACKQPLSLYINLKPALTPESLYLRLERDFERYHRKIFKNSLEDLLPKKMIPIFIELVGIAPDKPVNEISKSEKQKIVQTLRAIPLTIIGAREKEAIVTQGGVSVKEINPKTMESRLIKNLFFTGEIIDIDGYTGGYNLQAAFSTGYLAGINAALS